MLTHRVIRCAVGIFLFTGCATPSLVDRSVRVHDIHISGPALLSSVEVYAAVGDEIRWHNQLTAPIYLGFLGVSPIKEVGCGKGFTTWYGTIKDLVTIRAGEYVSACFSRAGTLRYNIWTNLADPVRTMSPMAVLYLEKAG